MKVDRKTAGFAKAVVADGSPELVAKVDRGEVSVSRAATVAKLPREAQLAALEKDLEWTDKVRHVPPR